MKNYSQRREEWIAVSIQTGEEIGMQRFADMIALALNDPKIMGKDVFGSKRIAKLFREVERLNGVFAPAYQTGPEQDYYQELLDRPLKTIFGDGFVPFAVRYENIKQPKYGKKK